MFRGAKIFGCAVALMFGIQSAAAAGLDCVNNRRVDHSGHVLLDANGKPVPCGYIGPAAEATTCRFIWARARCWSAAASRRCWPPTTLMAAGFVLVLLAPPARDPVTEAGDRRRISKQTLNDAKSVLFFFSKNLVDQN